MSSIAIISAHNSFLNPNSLATPQQDAQAVLNQPVLAVQNTITTTDQQQEALLAQLGAEAVLELISAGMIPEEIALTFHVRIQLFNEWVLKNITQEKLHEAKKSAAALYRARAVRVVEEAKTKSTTMKAAEVSYIKLMAEVYTDMSKAMDPAEWNPRPSGGGEDAPLSVTFNMMGGGVGGDPTSVQTVVNGTAHEVNLTERTQPTEPPTQSVEDVMFAIEENITGIAPEEAPSEQDPEDVSSEDVVGQE